MKEENAPRSHYPLARVVKTYPGKEKVVRTFKVKTPSNTVARPVSKTRLMEKYTRDKFTL